MTSAGPAALPRPVRPTTPIPNRARPATVRTTGADAKADAVEVESGRAATAVCSLPPRAPGLPGSRFILRKSGRPDLRWGRAGEGGRSYGAKVHPPTATPTPNPSPAGCGLARFRQYESDQPRQAGVGWGGEHTVRVATSCIQLNGTRFSVPIPKFASLRGTLVCELRNQRDTGNP
jgi:hypothetical protein